MKIWAIIQARLGATRLPGKVLLKLNGRTVLEHVIARVLKAKTINGVVVATTVNKEDLSIVHLVSGKGISVYCGSSEDVLDRYYQAARLFNIEHVIRITADCPVIDPKIIDRVVSDYFKKQADYCSNTLRETFPDGQDVEVFSFKALTIAWRNAKLSSEREHVTPYIRKRAKLFKLVSYENKIDLSKKRWTLDRIEDYRLLKILFQHLYKNNSFFGMQEIINFLKENSDLEKINGFIVRNEGYLKSLKQEKIHDEKKWPASI
jgi:spore coat polysaccharide biosynthesis protein SpsF (cytidylyltransferase family)